MRWPIFSVLNGDVKQIRGLRIFYFAPQKVSGSGSRVRRIRWFENSARLSFWGVAPKGVVLRKKPRGQLPLWEFP